MSFLNSDSLITAIILAAGCGKRMKSDKSKLLHEVGCKPIMQHVLDSVSDLSNNIILVLGHKSEQIKNYLEKTQNNQKKIIKTVLQKEQLGTANAVQSAVSLVNSNRNSQVLILCGDVPLISKFTLEKFIENTEKDELGVITSNVKNPTGLGRIIRDKNNNENVLEIIEEKDATDKQKSINEINSGIFLVPSNKLENWLNQIDNNNKQNEYYLTDIVKKAISENIKVKPFLAQEYEVLGINTRVQLAEVERLYQLQQAEKIMLQGVSLRDPTRIDLRPETNIEKDFKLATDIEIDINVILEGKLELGSNVKIGSNVIIKNSIIKAGAEILSNTVIEDSVIGENCIVGPFARIRPKTELKNKSKIGNFVEVKNTVVGEGSKASHLSYLGDSEIGEKVNIGAGSITCNYDGKNKHKTVIEDNVFIGSDCQLIAPVTIGKDAVIAAGTTVIKDAPQGKLILNLKKQEARNFKDKK